MAGSELDRTSTAVPQPAGTGGRHALLLVLAGPEAGLVHPLPPGQVLHLGRSEDAGLRLRDGGVSRRHATVLVDEQGATLQDLGSANGTFVDGVRVAETRLADGARIALGAATVLELVWTDELEARWLVRLAEGAHLDAVTGLHDRPHLDERLDAELSASLRHGRPLSVLLVEVGHLGAAGDQHGHPPGDEAVRLAAPLLREAIRKEDVLARYGEAALAVLSRETTMAGARVLGERLRQAVERGLGQRQGAEAQLTISVGVAVSARLGPFEPGDSARTLLAWAERALVLARQAGRSALEAVDAEAWPPAG